MKVDILHLDNNVLSGTLPQQWSSLAFLGYLNVSGNKIAGSIPDAWSRLDVNVLV